MTKLLCTYYALGLALLFASLSASSVTAQPTVPIPDQAGQAILIKNTLAALNHANITGNYTVLRDLSGERFRQQNKDADLSLTFANLRKQNLDLSPILVTEPTLTQAPETDQIRGRVKLVGYFATRPQAVRFALIFEHVQGGWMIDEISVGVVPLESAMQPQQPRSNQFTSNESVPTDRRVPSTASNSPIRLPNQ